MAIKQEEKLEVVNKFGVTGKIQVLGEPLTKLKLSTQVKAVHEENVKGTYDEDTRPDEEYKLANTVEVDKVERYYVVEERKLVGFD